MEVQSSTIETINFVVISITVASLVCLCFSFWMVLLCRRLPPHIKYTAVSFLLSNILAFLCVLVHRIFIYGLAMHLPLLKSSQFTTTSMFFAIASATVTQMSTDRLIAVMTPFQHKRYMTRKNVLLALCMQWVGVSILMLSAWSLSLPCPYSFGEQLQQLGLSRYVNVFTALVFPVLSMLACSALLYRLNRKNRKLERFQKRFYRVTRLLFTTIVVHTVLGLPYVVHFTILEIFPASADLAWRKVLQTFSYVCLCGNLLFNSFFYVLSLKECRNNAARVFCIYRNGGKIQQLK